MRVSPKPPPRKDPTMTTIETYLNENLLDDLLGMTHGALYRDAGVTAFRSGGTVKVVRGGYVRAILSSLGGERVLTVWESPVTGEWRTEVSEVRSDDDGESRGDLWVSTHQVLHEVCGY